MSDDEVRQAVYTFRRAVDAAVAACHPPAEREGAALRPRQLVRHRGAPDAPVRVWRVTRFGVWVTLADGRRVCWHPDDVEAAR